jgi:mRNA-degrading endonuclease RelE of RelBE toxin-antitoxin system
MSFKERVPVEIDVESKKGIEIDRRVGIALSVLPKTQQAAFERIVRSPESFSRFASMTGRVRQLRATGSPYYALRITPSLRLIYTMVGETVYVLDLVEQATFRYMRARRKSRGAINVSPKVSSSGPSSRKKPVATPQ